MTTTKTTEEFEFPHVPAAFINNIAEEGTKEEAIRELQLLWNELCYRYGIKNE